MSWTAAFALTLAVELPLAAALAPRGLRRRAASDGALFNALTHPGAWMALATFGPAAWWWVEGAVAVVETALYAGVSRLGVGRAALVAVVANGASAAVAWVN